MNDNIQVVAQEMRRVAQANPHDYSKQLLISDILARKIKFRGQDVNVAFSLDIHPSADIWHLSVTPEAPLLKDELQEIVHAFFGDDPAQDLTDQIGKVMPLPPMQRQFFHIIMRST